MNHQLSAGAKGECEKNNKLIHKNLAPGFPGCPFHCEDVNFFGAKIRPLAKVRCLSMIRFDDKNHFKMSLQTNFWHGPFLDLRAVLRYLDG